MDAQYTAEELRRLERNVERATAFVEKGFQEPGSGAPRELALELERIVVDPATGLVVPFEGERGLAEVFARLSSLLHGRTEEGQEHPIRFVGRVPLAGGNVPCDVHLGPGGQLSVEVGPSTSVVSLLEALEAFDERFRMACDASGVPWQMVALGLDPVPCNPREVPLVPGERYRLLDAYLCRTGRYSRDMMRLSAATRVSVGCGPASSLLPTFRLAVALGPVLSFLCDNVSSWRGLSPQDTPRMCRSRIWDHVDPSRCSLVPGTFSEDFTVSAYIDWLLGLRSVFFAPDDGEEFSTGSATVRDVMALRDLSDEELEQLVSCAFPTVRVQGTVQVRDADAMPPRLAAALAAFLKGLLCNEAASRRAQELLLGGIDEDAVLGAYEALRTSGWDARVYGYPMSSLVPRLIQLAENGLEDPRERTLFHALSSLWQAHLVPKDLYAEESAVV